MILAHIEKGEIRCRFTNGKHTSFADATAEKGGGETGFRPHELLEAALATGIAMTLRIYSQKHNILLDGVSAQVTLNREPQDEVIFEYSLQLEGLFSDEDKARLHEVAKHCSVHKTLLKKLSFNEKG